MSCYGYIHLESQGLDQKIITFTLIVQGALKMSLWLFYEYLRSTLLSSMQLAQKFSNTLQAWLYVWNLADICYIWQRHSSESAVWQEPWHKRWRLCLWLQRQGKRRAASHCSSYFGNTQRPIWRANFILKDRNDTLARQTWETNASPLLVPFDVTILDNLQKGRKRQMAGFIDVIIKSCRWSPQPSSKHRPYLFPLFFDERKCIRALRIKSYINDQCLRSRLTMESLPLRGTCMYQYCHFPSSHQGFVGPTMRHFTCAVYWYLLVHVTSKKSKMLKVWATGLTMVSLPHQPSVVYWVTIFT